MSVAAAAVVPAHTADAQHVDVLMTPSTPNHSAATVPTASSSSSSSTADSAAQPTSIDSALQASQTATVSSSQSSTSTAAPASSSTSSNPAPSSSSSSATQSHVEASHSYSGPVRARDDRMIIKLTTNLMHTYNAINEKYYANKRKRLLEQQAAAAALKAKGITGAQPLQYNEGHDDKDYNYLVQSHELFANRYVVDHSIGKGSFGRVVKAFDTLSKKYVAIKIIKSKSAFYKQAQIELKILMSLQQDADKWNIVSVIDQFIHKAHQCIVFELLSLNLYELLRNTRFTGVSLKLIAKFAQQLLCTLGYLGSKERGEKRIIHCDLKPENILLRNCFPVADHQLLTNEGFLFEGEVRRRLEQQEKQEAMDNQSETSSSLATSRPLTIACYSSTSRSIEYHPIRLSDLIVQRGTHRIVQFQSSNTDSPLHLTVTDNHDMYVKQGQQQRDGRVEWETNSSNGAKSDADGFSKSSAESLTKQSTSNSRLAFLSRAQNGLALSKTAAPLPFLHLLHSSSSTVTSAFLQLYGFVLAHGFTLSLSSLLLSSLSPLSLSSLRRLFALLAWREGECWSMEGEAGVRLHRSVVVDFFGQQDGQRAMGCCDSRHSCLHLPSWVLQDLSLEQMRALISGMQTAVAAGVSSDSSSHAFFTSCSRWRDQLTMLLLHAGYHTHFTSTTTLDVAASSPSSASAATPFSLPPSSPFSLALLPSAAVFQLHYSDATLGPVLAPQQDVQTGTLQGDVWCVNVPHADHLIIARKVVLDQFKSECNTVASSPSLLSASSAVIVGNCKKSAIKVIDFGSACFANQKTYTYIQSRFYRSPEVLLGLSYNGAIDMWSLGCILVEMHTGKPLFDGQDEADQMVKQVEILGIPPKHMLEKNRKAEKFFEWSESTQMFRLKKKFNANLGLNLRTSLGPKWEDTVLYKEFEDLISCMLIYDPLKRIRPSQALAHPFFSAVASTIAAEAGAASAAAGASASSSSKAADAQMSPATGDAAAAGATAGGATAMDTSSPAIPGGVTQAVSAMAQAQAQQKFAYMQQQQQHAHHHHHHHHSSHLRAGSRKRPHSNPVLGAGSATSYMPHAPLQPLDAHVQQAILAQAAKSQKQAAAAQPAAAAAAAAAAVAPPQRNNLMLDTDEAAKAAAAAATVAAAATATTTAAAMDEQPDASSSTIQGPSTPAKHGMVTRSAAGASSGQKNRDSLDIGKLAVNASATSSGSNSARSSPDHTSTQLAPAASSSDKADNIGVDASTVTTANPSQTSSPKAPTHAHAALLHAQAATSMVDVDGDTSSSSSSSATAGAVAPSVDEAPLKSSAAAASAGASAAAGGASGAAGANPPSQDVSPNKPKGGSGRKGKKGKGQQQNAALAAAGNESDSSASSNAMVDGDSAVAVGYRTRSHANQ